MKRRYAVLAGAAVLAFALAGCSSEGGEADEASKGAVAMSYPRLSAIPIWQETLDAMRPIIEKAGYEFLTDDPGSDVQAQVSDWQAWGTRGDVKAVMGFAQDASAAAPVTKELQGEGVKVIAYGAPWDGVDATMFLDSKADGLNIGKGIVEGSGKKGNGSGVEVAILSHRTSTTASVRADAAIEGIKSLWPKATIDDIPFEGTRESAYNAVAAYLAAHPDTKVWGFLDNQSALGGYQALTEFGMAPDEDGYSLGSLDSNSDIVELSVKPNSVWKSVWSYPAKALAEANADMLIKAAEGKKLKDVQLSSVKITSKNASKYFG